MALTTELAQRAEDRLGSVLNGKWHLDRILGVGGMATVYAATHRNKKRVAIKMLHPEVSISAEVTTRFLREGYVANSVEHTGACNVIDDDVTPDGAAFLVMELLEGETLEARRERKGGRLSPAEVLSLTGQLLDVLVAAHGKGIVHRDLKPENIFLTTEGRVKVLDFGIARLREASVADTGATQAGSLLGTPAFMAPEQARGRSEQVDERTDLWAVGATMFTLLTGRPVHLGETVNEQLIFAATNPAPHVSTIADVHPAVAEVVDRALAFERSARWQDARAMHAAVRRALEEALPEAPVSLLLGPSQRHIADDAATMAAPSGQLSRPGISLVGAGTTARPLTGSIEAKHEARARALKLSAIGAAALLVGVIGAGLLFRKPHVDNPVPETHAAVRPVDEHRIQEDPRPIAEPVTPPTTSAPSPNVVPPSSASPDPIKPRPPTSGKPPTVALPKDTSKDVGPKVPVPPTPATSNPFDKRF